MSIHWHLYQRVSSEEKMKMGDTLGTALGVSSNAVVPYTPANVDFSTISPSQASSLFPHFATTSAVQSKPTTDVRPTSPDTVMPPLGLPMGPAEIDEPVTSGPASVPSVPSMEVQSASPKPVQRRLQTLNANNVSPILRDLNLGDLFSDSLGKKPSAHGSSVTSDQFCLVRLKTL